MRRQRSSRPYPPTRIVVALAIACPAIPAGVDSSVPAGNARAGGAEANEPRIEAAEVSELATYDRSAAAAGR
jgi:hypothetical protein